MVTASFMRDYGLVPGGGGGRWQSDDPGSPTDPPPGTRLRPIFLKHKHGSVIGGLDCCGHRTSLSRSFGNVLSSKVFSKVFLSEKTMHEVRRNKAINLVKAFITNVITLVEILEKDFSSKNLKMWLKNIDYLQPESLKLSN